LNRGGKPIVRVVRANGLLPLIMACVTEDEARIYARGLVDGARHIASEIESPLGYHYVQDEE
jgi:hypothetical protein